MKNMLITAVSAVAISLISCKKTESGNKNVLKGEDTATVLADNGAIDSTITYDIDVNGKKSVKTDYVYKATDGTLVKVVYNYQDNTMSIRSNNKTFILKKLESKGNETVYEKEDMKATVKRDSLILNQDNNIIELVKTKI